MTSMSSPSLMARQLSHLQQGVVVGLSKARQFMALAKMRAMLVLPTPRVPVNR
ncbi:MAG: hypothetical protein BWY71_01211 [Planctomycetes bacterium ADurb.Bin412]|nr:MAG: hypothetical protein BWY71_01211 [Planctomycetes bacterium ADurb.Bin412]